VLQLRALFFRVEKILAQSRLVGLCDIKALGGNPKHEKAPPRALCFFSLPLCFRTVRHCILSTTVDIARTSMSSSSQPPPTDRKNLQGQSWPEQALKVLRTMPLDDTTAAAIAVLERHREHDLTAVDGLPAERQANRNQCRSVASDCLGQVISAERPVRLCDDLHAPVAGVADAVPDRIVARSDNNVMLPDDDDISLFSFCARRRDSATKSMMAAISALPTSVDQQSVPVGQQTTTAATEADDLAQPTLNPDLVVINSLALDNNDDDSCDPTTDKPTAEASSSSFASPLLPEQRLPSTERPAAEALPDSHPVTPVDKSVVAPDYFTLRQFVDALSTVPRDIETQFGDGISAVSLGFSVAALDMNDAIHKMFSQRVKGTIQGRTDDIASIAAASSPQIPFNVVNLTRADACAKRSPPVTAGRLYDALAPLAAMNGEAGVCLNNEAVQPRMTLAFDVDEDVRFSATALNPLKRDPAFADAIDLARRCIKHGMASGEVLAMIERAAPRACHVFPLALLRVGTRLMPASEFMRTLWRAKPYGNILSLGPIFGDVARSCNIAGGLSVTMAETEISLEAILAAFSSGDGAVDALPRSASRSSSDVYASAVYKQICADAWPPKSA
jgi:hypothetical protein